MALKKLGRVRWVAVCALGLMAFLPVALSAQAAASATTLVEPPTPLLPSTETLVAANEQMPVPVESAEAQAILKEDGLMRSEGRVSVASAGAQEANGWVKAYEFSDATGAFAAYSYLRMGGRPVGAGRVNATEMVTAGGEHVLLSGTSVVRARGVGGEVLAKIEIGLPKISGRRGLAPLLPTLVPRAETDGVAARYALGPVGYQAMGGVLPAADLGWDKSLEVISVPTVGKAGRGTLTLLLYPTPQIAGDRGRAVEAMVNVAGNHYGMVKLRRVGPLVAMANGAMTAEQAHALVEGIKLNQEVSFDQKMPLEFHAEVRKTASLLQNIAVLCGVLIAAAVLLGLFLGGARAGVRVLMGKPAASEPEFLTINLRDGGRARESKNKLRRFALFPVQYGS